MAITLISNFMKPKKGILQEPSLFLRVKSKPIQKIDSSVQVVAKNLLKVLRQVDSLCRPWLGMAAPQVGHDQRIIAIKKRFHRYLIMVNPEVIEQRFELPAISGCFSLRGLYLIKSPYWLKVKYQDLKGRQHTDIFLGGKAVVLKQEIGHLDGKLICD